MRCPIAGCKNPPVAGGLVCTPHGVQIWAHVETVRDKSGFAELVDVERDRMQRQAQDNARAVAATRARGWIYFLELDDKIKVGWTSNLENRIKSYPPHARMVVEYPATRADERDLHRTLRQSLVAGREWYARTPQVLNCMRDVQLAKAKQYAEEQAASEARRAQASQAVPTGRPPRQRPLRGQALVRAVLAGQDT